MSLHVVITVNMEYFFTFNGMFLLYLKMFYLKKINSRNENVEN